MREAITLTFDNNSTALRELDHSEAGLPEDDTSHPLRGDAPVEPQAPTFAELGVDERIVRALGEAGIVRTFAIQELTLPLALRGEDLIGQARTGTGKTLGFGVPLLHRLTLPGDGTPQVLVVVPTRELCLQVTHDLRDAGKHLGVRVLDVYGGRPYEPQVAALRKGVDVIVGTPGRLLDLAERRDLVLGKVRALVLDEADEMLDLGFLPDIERILRMVPEQRQTMLFSATMPGPIITLARTFLTQPTHIRAEEVDAGQTHERTEQFAYRAHSLDKIEVVSRVLQADGRGLTMIFTRTKRTAQKLADDLAERGFAVAPVHGDLGQGAREQALRAFRSGKVDVLVCTDVAARGIDVGGVTHVINYQCPEDEKTYVHRIGRTGRAGATGVAVTLVDWDEEARWKMISDALGLDKPEPVETYSTSDHLFTDLHIDPNSTGRLPLSKRTRAGLDAEHLEEDAPKRGGRNRRRGRGSDKPGSADRPENEDSGARPATKRRTRRRTRGGLNSDGAEPVETTTDTTPVAEETEAKPTRSRSRTRTRRGKSDTPEAETTAATETPVEAPVADAPATAAPVTEAPAAETPATEAPAKPARTRTRTRAKATTEAPAAETPAEAPAAETSAAEAPAEAPATAPRTRTRSRAKAAPAAAAPAESTEVAEAPAPTTRTRSRAKAAPAAEAEAAPAEAAPATPRTRTRAKAAAPVEAAPAAEPETAPKATKAPRVAAPVLSAEEPAPKRTPLKASTTVLFAAPDLPTPEVEPEAAAPRRRRRRSN
ncbi:superfamily II DNA/RNA helicase [Crossiella equi]|uniref:RNA helicase n=1 Tax=Crossiella equi TaxID=130796 RepID=A0ABS5ALI2_9PSEU|nr:DEAD/DEAH box helicase [Crossiella equi]MBP2476530.1 superfamily II DNA/RNA helicase [Crossiella equi]